MAKKKNNKNRRGKKEAAIKPSVGIEDSVKKKDEEAPAVTSEPTPSTTTIDDRKSQAQDTSTAAAEVEEKPADFAALRDSLEERASSAKNNTTQNIPDSKWNEKFKTKDDEEASAVKEKVVAAANKGEDWSPQREVPRGSVSQHKEVLEASTATDVFYSCRGFAQDVEESVTAPEELPEKKKLDEALEKEDAAALFYSCKDNAPDLEELAPAIEKETPDKNRVSMVDEALGEENESANAEETTVESKESSLHTGQKAAPKVDLGSSGAEDAKEQHSEEANDASPPVEEEEGGESRARATTTAAEATPAREENEAIVVDDDDKGSWAISTKLYFVLTKLLTRACCTKRVRSSRQ